MTGQFELEMKKVPGFAEVLELQELEELQEVGDILLDLQELGEILEFQGMGDVSKLRVMWGTLAMFPYMCSLILPYSKLDY